MEVSVIGKALTPVPLHYVSSHRSDYEMNKQVKQIYLPLSRHYNDPKPPILLNSRLEESESWNQDDSTADRSKLLTPAFRNMTLSETYNFARAQLKAYPIQQLQHKRNLKTPVFSFTKLESNNSAPDEKAEEPETSRSLDMDIPLVSCGARDDDPKPGRCNQTTVRNKERSTRRLLDRHNVKSVCALRRVRRKSSRKKKTVPNSSLATKPDLGCDARNLSFLPTDLPIRRQLLPPRTQSSVIILKSMREGVLPPHFKSKRDENVNHLAVSLKLPSRSLTKRSGLNPPIEDSLLKSLDSPLSRKGRTERQFAMRIQLIHKYGDEDVIGKHMEIKRKKEAADRHEKKNLEHQANARLKEIQRSKIYALNALMTKLEQEQFEEYKHST